MKMYYTAYFLSVKICFSLCEEDHLGNGFVIQPVSCVSPGMSVLHTRLVSCADQMLARKSAEILYAYWYILHFFILHGL